MHIKVNDTVVILTGDDQGQRGRVMGVDHQAGKLLVEGVNRVYKHVRRSQKNPQGGRLSKEMPVQLSNVKLICDRCGTGVRTGARYTSEGAKERFCRKCGTGLGQIAPPRPAYAS